MRKLHIGGTVKAPGWEVINVMPGPYVDHVGDAVDLSRFEDRTFGEVYASHVLEHFDYAGGVQAALREWCRVLEAGGILYVSVPDLETLAELFLRKNDLNLEERFNVMRLIFGGHIDQYDHHGVGFNQELLAGFLDGAGFRSMQRVDNFGLFEDSSSLYFKGVPISLNMRAEKP